MRLGPATREVGPEGSCDPDSGFEDFRTASLDVARELYGQDSREYQGDRPLVRGRRARGTWVAPEVEGC